MIAKLFIKAGVENDCYSNGKHDLNSEVQNTITISLKQVWHIQFL